MGFGLLGMLAAGGASGAARASNMNVQAQNQLEMENNRNANDMDREALRQEFLDRQYNTNRADNIENSKNQALIAEATYNRTRADKLADRESDRAHQIGLLGMKEAGENARLNKTLSAKAKESGINGGGKIDSPIGKATMDLVRLGIAPDVPSAYEMAVKLDIVKAAQQNPMNKFSDNELLGSVDRLTKGLFPRQQGATGQTQQQQPQRLKYEDLLK